MTISIFATSYKHTKRIVYKEKVINLASQLEPDKNVHTLIKHAQSSYAN